MSATVAFLDAGDEGEAARWLRVWERIHPREPFSHPAFARLFAEEGERAMCAVVETEDGAALFPFVLRPLAALPWAHDEAGWDMTTPYGYGGCFAQGDVDAEAFWDAVDAWAAAQGVVTAFARLSLFPEQTLPFRGEIADAGPNVVRSLDLVGDALWMDYKHKVRKNVNRARSEGLRVEVDAGGRRLEDFARVYYSTMDRRHATSGYYFPEALFRRLCGELAGQFVFFHVLDGDAVVSTELVLLGETRMYSFLGGMLEAAKHKRPNDLLKHEAIQWGAKEGLETFVLGGGHEVRDTIFSYKLSFAPHGEVPFRVGKRVYDQDACDRLVAARAAHEPGWAPRPDFFPAYRS